MTIFASETLADHYEYGSEGCILQFIKMLGVQAKGEPCILEDGNASTPAES